MPFSSVVQLELPTVFPLSAFEEFWNAARAVIPQSSSERREFNAATSLIAFRFRGCIEYKDEFIRSWQVAGVAASFEEQYVRERALFGMFVDGVSTIESLCYANYALGAVKLSLPFDEGSRKNATPNLLLKAVKEKEPTSRLTTALGDVLGSEDWRLWRDYRNTMAHRSPIPRIIYASTGTLPPANMLEYAETWSTAALSGNEQALADRIQWVAFATRRILEGGIHLARTS
jgi:hypothetical protein